MDFSDQTIYKVKLTLYVNKKPRTQEAAGTLLELSEKTFVFKNLQRGAEIMAEARIKNPDGFAAWAGKSNTIKLAYNENNLSIRMKTVKYFATGPDFNDAITNKSNIKKIVFGLLSDSSIKAAVSEPTVANTKVQVGAEDDTYYAYYKSANETLYIVPADEDATEIVLNQNSASLFQNFKCESIEGLGLVDTSNVTDMRDMFYNCGRLTTLDVSGFDTSNVTDMRDMFFGCESLTTLDLSSFDTSNVTDMQEMFMNCENLTTIYVKYNPASGFVHDRVFFRMFYLCGVTDANGLTTKQP